MPPRIRSLKPDIWKDEKLGRCSIGARLLFVGLISQADDEGRFRSAPPLLRASIFPHDDPLAGLNGQIPGIGGGSLDVDGWLDELTDARLIRLYEVRGERYGDLPGWARHQRVDHPRASELPACRKPKKRSRAGDSQKPREGSRNLAPDMEGEGDRDKPLSSSGSTSARSDIDQVWQAYADRHPRAVLTTKRRRLISDRLRDYPAERLVAAIAGNHLDPHCNGDNDRDQTYHDLELILRDAAHVERYEALAHGANGQVAGESRLDWARRVYAEAHGGAS
jgi:hypothetical protein